MPEATATGSAPAPAAPSNTTPPTQSATPAPAKNSAGTTMTPLTDLATGTPNPTKAEPAGQPDTAADMATLKELLGRADKKEVFKLLGLKTKANGREVPLDDLDKAIRYAQRGLGPEQALEEVAALKAQVEPRARLLEAIAKGNVETREQALSQLVSPEELDALAEQRMLRKIQQAQKYEQLSPDARRYAQEADALREQQAQFQAQREQYEAQQRQAHEVQQVQHAKSELANVATKTLEAMGLPPTQGQLGPMALALLSPLLKASYAAGVAPEPAQLAERADAQLTAIHQWKCESLAANFDQPGWQGGDKLEAFLGKNVIRALLAHLQSKQSKGMPQQPKTVTEKPAERPRVDFRPGRW